MRGICPNCERETELTLLQGREEIVVRGEPIVVQVHYYRCGECNVEFADPRCRYDPLEEAYRVYRSRHGLLPPEEIQAFRQRYGLSQKELSGLLGWGGATLSRYENGALQSEAHDNALRLAMEPANLLKLIDANPEAIEQEKRASLVEQLRREVDARRISWRALFQERFGDYPADELSGHRKLDLDKLFNAMLFFSDEGVSKTKLNKLLFYADFAHCREYGVSITGARYVRLPYGPVPDNYAHYLAALLHNESAITIEETLFGEYVGEVITAARPPDLNLFSASELKVLATVKEHFQHHSATQISELSHRERGYAETPEGGLISYGYAACLMGDEGR